MIIDPTSPIGKVRLRIADVNDMPYLSDGVIQSALDESSGSVVQASKTCAMYVLGMLAHKTHRKMNQLEVYGEQAFFAYKSYLMLCYKDPAFMDFSPVPYSSTAEFSPILDFQKNWNAAFTNGTEAQQLAFTGDLNPDADARTGAAGKFHAR